jgi:hypothetical protein
MGKWTKTDSIARISAWYKRSRAATRLPTAAGFRTAPQKPLNSTHESARGAAEGGGNGVDKDNLAAFDAEVVGVGGSRKLGKHFYRADGFIDNVAADVWM